jgi:hypothetical protein
VRNEKYFIVGLTGGSFCREIGMNFAGASRSKRDGVYLLHSEQRAQSKSVDEGVEAGRARMSA